MNELSFLYSHATIAIMFVAVIALFSLLLYKLNKKYAGKGWKMGQILAYEGVDNHETIVVIAVILMYVAEAVVAATVHRPDEVPPDPIARITSHMLISIVGAVCSITAVRDVVSVVALQGSIWQRIGRFILVTIILAVALGTPFGNLSLIASGLGKDEQLSLWFYSFYARQGDWLYTLQVFSLPQNYNAWAALPTILKTSIVMTGLHMTLTAMEGLRNVISPRRIKALLESAREAEEAEERQENKENKDKKETKEHPEGTLGGEKRAYDKALDNIRFLLRRMDYEGAKLNGMASEALKVLDTMYHNDPSAAIAMAVKVSDLRIRCEKVDRESGSDKAKKKEQLKEDIRSLFRGRRDADDKNRGFGITLKGEKN